MAFHYDEEINITTLSQDKNRCNTIKPFFTRLKPSQPVPASNGSPTFLVRRDSTWVDPAEPLLAPYMPASPPPADHQSYAAWLYQHHAEEKLMQLSTNDASNHGISSSATTICNNASSSSSPRGSCEISAHHKLSPSPLSRAERTRTSSRLTGPRKARSSWWRRLNLKPKPGTPRREETSTQPTFRVWLPYPANSTEQAKPTYPNPSTINPIPQWTTQDAPLPSNTNNVPTPPGQGQWVAHPSILLSETAPQREERLRWERTYKPPRCRKGPQSPPLWMMVGLGVVVVAGLPVALAVLGARRGREEVSGWWRGRRGRKIRTSREENGREEREDEKDGQELV